MISVSAPAKIHLIGEHAVVYGHPAILGAIDKRIEIDVEKSDDVKFFYRRNKKLLKKFFTVEDCRKTAEKVSRLWEEGNKKGDFTPLFNFLKSASGTYFKAIAGFLLTSFKIKKGISFRIKTKLEAGTGLGFSAALAVSLTKGFCSLFNIKLSRKKINEIGYQIEKLNHGSPSGGDNTVSSFGGILFFEKEKFEKLKVPNFLKNLIIIFTKREKLTGELVQKVKNLNPKLKKAIIENIGKNAKKMKGIIEKEDFENFKKLINQAQKDLKKLHVSSPKIDEIVRKVKRIGGVAKLSGAGGGGAILCFHHEKEKLISAVKKMNLPFFEAKIEKEGVKMEK